MSLNIKSEEAERLAREVAGVTGETLTGAITLALRERLERLQAGRDAETARRVARVRRIAEQAAPRWVEPYRSTEHGAVLYDESGLPR